MNTHAAKLNLPVPNNTTWGTPYVDEALAASRGQNPSLRQSLATSGWLLGLNGVHVGEDLRLYPGVNTIGASARCDVVVTAPDAGRQHAIVDVISGESAILHPGSSRRQLWLNDELCEGASPLCHGDTIQIGEQLFAFVTLLPVPSGESNTIVLRDRLTFRTPCTAGWLIELNGRAQGRDYRLFFGENHIGSQSGLEVSIADAEIKPRHCVITRHSENWTVVPLSVTEPLLVNGIPSTGTGLENGDILTFGRREFMFRCVRLVVSK
ncbi:MAG: Inner rane component of cytoplasmic domain [Pseudomonadota bacterium]|jgi:pSer/pThr/pTyr-binding forkhead associated (FHA) protein